MRIQRAVLIAGMTLLSVPTFAGTLSVNNGQTVWQSTKCMEPVEPDSLLKANRETMANRMNALSAQYNDYASKMQAYMDCVSNEAQSDATATSDAITHSAQTQLDAARGKVDDANAKMRASSTTADNKRERPKIDIQ